MAFDHEITDWDRSVFKYAEESKSIIGFDGMFSLPDEKRVMLELTQLGERVMMMKMLQYLKLEKQEARKLFFEIIRQPMPDSIEDVDAFFKELNIL